MFKITFDASDTTYERKENMKRYI